MQEAQRLDVLAIMYEMKGELDRAIKTHEASLDLRRSIDPNDKSIAYGLHNYGGVLESAGYDERALEVRREASRRFKEHFGADNPLVAQVDITLANLLRKQRKFQEAEQLYQQSLPTLRASFGENHQEIANTYHGLGVLKRETGALEAAIKYHEKAIQIYTEVHSDSHPKLARAKHEYARTLWYQGSLDQAAEAIQEARDSYKNSQGKHQRHLAEVECLYAEILYEQENYETAKQTYAEAQSRHPEKSDKQDAERNTRLAIGIKRAHAQISPESAAATIEYLNKQRENEGVSTLNKTRANLGLAELTTTTDPQTAKIALDQAQTTLTSSTTPHPALQRQLKKFRAKNALQKKAPASP